jgi:16S rRNA (cytosine1402-N4)-methyltransferase
MMAKRETASGDSGSVAAPRHVPVLLKEIVQYLAPVPSARIIDGTFGAGGYTEALLKAAPGLRVLAIERDPDARAAARDLLARYAGNLALVDGRFGDLAAIAEAHDFRPVNGVVLDIGVSSMQLDEADRGFSFMAEGPLDMRMERTGPTAADLVNEMAERDLADVIFAYGEERQSRRIARAIVKARESRPIATTRELANLVERALGRRHDEDRHPATRTFQALRIAVNDELGELARGLAAAEAVLAPGGRLVVVTFHSREDRIVKRFLMRRSGRQGAGSRHGPPAAVAAAPSFEIVNHRPVTPSQTELAANPRARSAKLRAAVRTEAPPWPPETAAGLGLPDVAERLRTYR